jgi:tight adherence protein C
MSTGNLFIDVATLAGFALVSFLAFVLLDSLLGGRRRAVFAGEIDFDVSVGGTRKAGFVKSMLAHSFPQLGSEVEAIRRDLRRAGYYGASALEDYLATRNVFLYLVLCAFVAMAVAVSNPQFLKGYRLPANGPNVAVMLLVAGAILAALIYSLPRLALRRQARARVARVERGLPDALDIVQMCLTGGLPLRDSLQHVANEIRYTHPDIAVEFDIIRRQADAGTMAKALRNFADRIDAPDIKALASTVTQTERMGTEVAVAVAEFADRMRLQYRQRAEERASKASVLLLFPIIFCLVPPLLIAIAGPPIIKLRNFIKEANQPGGVLDLSAPQRQLQTPQRNPGQAPTPQPPSVNQ